MIVEGAKEAFDIAKTKQDGKAMAAALDKIGKYTRADKDDDAFDFSKLTPPSFEPSDDVTLLGDVEKIPNLEERRKTLRRLFSPLNPPKGDFIDAEIITDEKPST